MLRITTNNDPQALTLRLEGRLEGPWVAVLAQCWSGALLNLNGRRLRIDLNGVTFVDAQGKARWRRCTRKAPSSSPRISRPKRSLRKFEQVELTP